MKRQNKLDDGLNRLFSSSKQNPADESPEEAEPVKETKPEVKKSPAKKATNKAEPKAEPKTEPKAPPKSHLIPVPSKPTLPLQMPFADESDETGITDEIQDVTEPTVEVSVEQPVQVKAASQKPADTPKASTNDSKTSAVVSSPVEQKPVAEKATADKTSPTSNESNEQKAVVEKAGAKTSEDEQIVVFTLANQYYGVNIRVVESIIKMQSITVVPRAPQYIEGVTNLRGTVVPVVSLHKRLNIPVVDESATSRIIVINSHGVNAGLIVDEVNSVSQISGNDIEQVSQSLSSIDSSYIRAIAKIEGKLIVLLELENVLKERT